MQDVQTKTGIATWGEVQIPCPVGIVPCLALLRCQGRTNPAFSKPCLFLSDTRHFRHFRRFRWSEEPNPCFQSVECKFVIFAVFVKMAPFWQGTKTRFTKNTVCATPIGVSELQTHDRICTGPFEQGQRAVAPSEGVQIWACLFLYGRSLPWHPHDRPSRNKHTQICTPSLTTTAL